VIGRLSRLLVRDQIFFFLVDYGGISASRLEILEERLKDDVITELNAFGGR